MLERVVSGGQTGADIAGLLAASLCGLQTGGHIPKGFKTEKGFFPALARFGLIETKSSGYEERTRLNVWDSDGTVLLARNWGSSGTVKTQEMCESIFKPFFRVLFPEKDDLVLTIPHDIVEWIQRENIHILNVAGNRESKAPGIQKWATQFLIDVFKEITDGGK